MQQGRLTCFVFNGLCALSLGLAVVVAGLWVRSETGRFNDLAAWHSRVDGDGWQSGVTLIARRGYIAVWGGQSQSEFKSEPGWTISFRRDASSHVPDDGADKPSFFGITHRYTNGSLPGNGFGAPSRPYTERYVAVSSPLLITIFLAAPGYWWMKRRRLRRLASAERCPACGYDLRASPERCPECGAVATTEATTV